MVKSYFLENQIKNAVTKVEDTGQPFVSNFLDPYEQSVWYSYHKLVTLEYSGGFTDAERQVVYVTDGSYDAKLTNNDFGIKIITAKLSSFNSIGHRQVLGSIMHSGLKRDVIGDILIKSDLVQIMVKEVIANHFLQNPLQIGRETLKFKIIDQVKLDQLPEENKIQEVLISSLRVDIFIAAVLKVSRSKVQALFSDNKVFVNFQLINKLDIF